MYIVDISNIHFKSESLRNILINMGSEDSVTKISFYNNIDADSRVTFENEAIKVDSECGNITIESTDSDANSDTLLVVKSIDDIRMDIFIKDRFDTNFESLGLKDYFSIFNQLSIHSITEYINSDYNVKYYFTLMKKLLSYSLTVLNMSLHSSTISAPDINKFNEPIIR